VLEALRRVSLFEGLGDGDLAALEAVVVSRSYPKNTVVVSEGDRSDTLFLILSGRVKIFVSDDDCKELVLNTQGPGDYFGEMILDDGPRSASAMTLEPCRLGVLTRERFRGFLAQHPDVAIAVIRNLILRCRALTENAKDLALLDVYGRLSKLLLSLARDEDGRLVVDENLTKQAIGERIGASREMVSRIFKDLTAGGYLRTEGKKIVILRRPPARW
jgi:CRP/FNR family transcriptional regulator, cyclic AMP receptor protein